MFVGVGIIYMLFGVINKLAAIFITVPMPVLGGVLIVMFGSFNRVILSNLKFIDISSSRNVTIIGISLLFGLMIPQWIENYPGAINTGKIYFIYLFILMSFYMFTTWFILFL